MDCVLIDSRSDRREEVERRRSHVETVVSVSFLLRPIRVIQSLIYFSACLVWNMHRPCISTSYLYGGSPWPHLLSEQLYKNPEMLLLWGCSLTLTAARRTTAVYFDYLVEILVVLLIYHMFDVWISCPPGNATTHWRCWRWNMIPTSSHARCHVDLCCRRRRLARPAGLPCHRLTCSVPLSLARPLIHSLSFHPKAADVHFCIFFFSRVIKSSSHSNAFFQNIVIIVLVFISTMKRCLSFRPGNPK